MKKDYVEFLEDDRDQLETLRMIRNMSDEEFEAHIAELKKQEEKEFAEDKK